MKNLFIVLVCFVAATSCVTPGDLRSLAMAQEKFEETTAASLEKIADKTATKEQVASAKEDIEEASLKFRESVEEIAAAVEERTTETLSGLPESAEGGIVGILAALAVNFYRSRTRRKELDEVWTEVETKKPTA